MSKKKKDSQKKKEIAPVESEDEGAMNWFYSRDGLEYMKVFVMLNSLLVFLMMAWPNIKQTLGLIYEAGEEYLSNNDWEE